MRERYETAVLERRSVEEIMSHFGEESYKGTTALPRAGAVVLRSAAAEIGAPVSFKANTPSVLGEIFPMVINAIEEKYGLKTALAAVIQAEEKVEGFELVGANEDSLLGYLRVFKWGLIRKDFNNFIDSIKFENIEELTEDQITEYLREYRNQGD